MVWELKLRRVQPSQSSCCVVRNKKLWNSLSQLSYFALKMPSKSCVNVFRALVLIAALADILLNIFFLFSTYMAKRDGTYNRYLWEWNAFYVARIATSALVLYSVIKSNLRLMIISSVLNGLILCVLIYAVSVAKFAYQNCERGLCRFTDNCDVCYARNYNDYHLTSKWTSKFDCGLEKL